MPGVLDTRKGRLHQPEAATSPGAARRSDSGLGRPFRKYWCATVVSAFGDNLRSAALPLLATTLTRDPRLISLVVVVGFLPWLLVGPLAGRFMDRLDSSQVMSLANAIRFALTAGFVFAVIIHWYSIGLLCALTFVLTVLQIFYSSAATAYLPIIVDEEKLKLANARLESGRSLAGQFLGAPVGAALFTFLHVLPFSLDSLTFAVSSAVLLIGTRGVRPPANVRGAGPSRVSAWGFLLRTRGVLAISGLLSAVNLVTSAIGATLVLFSSVALHQPAYVYGLLTGSLALGAFIGGYTSRPLLSRLAVPNALLVSVAARVVALLCLGLAPTAWMACVALIVQGLSATTWNVISTTLIQRLAPREILASVSAAVKTVAISTAPVGALAGGWLAYAVGLRSPALFGAVVVAMAGLPAIVAVRRDPSARL